MGLARPALGLLSAPEDQGEAPGLPAAFIDMERRHFLSLVTGSLCGLASHSELGVGDAQAKTQCATDKRQHVKVCTVSLSRPLQRIVVRPGKGSSAACWLASLHMIFKYHGYDVAPARISTEAYGGQVPAMPWREPERVSRTWTADRGRQFAARVELLPVRAADAAEELAEDQPLIVGVEGRPAVLTAMSYTGDRLGSMTIVQALVCDPWPGKHPRVVTSPQWVEVRFLTRVSLRKLSGKS